MTVKMKTKITTDLCDYNQSKKCQTPAIETDMHISNKNKQNEN